MARRRATDSSERLSRPLRAWVSPADHTRLRREAAREGKALSDHVRELCLRRRGPGPIVAGTRRNPAAKALADELRAIGINLNQLAKVANQTGEVRREGELLMVIDVLKAAMARVIAL